MVMLVATVNNKMAINIFIFTEWNILGICDKFLPSGGCPMKIIQNGRKKCYTS